MPIDLSESVEEVHLIHEDADLSNFSKQCLKQGRQVLGSVVYHFLNLFNHGETRMLVTKKYEMTKSKIFSSLLITVFSFFDETDAAAI